MHAGIRHPGTGARFTSGGDPRGGGQVLVYSHIIILIIIEGLSLLQSIPLTTANKQLKHKIKGEQV